MKLRLLESLFILLAVLVFDPLLVHAAAPLVKVLVTTGSASEREGTLSPKTRDFFAGMVSI
jgi:hypothetical protein